MVVLDRPVVDHTVGFAHESTTSAAGGVIKSNTDFICRFECLQEDTRRLILGIGRRGVVYIYRRDKDRGYLDFGEVGHVRSEHKERIESNLLFSNRSIVASRRRVSHNVDYGINGNPCHMSCGD